jgi:hypothetical protein
MIGSVTAKTMTIQTPKTIAALINKPLIGFGEVDVLQVYQDRDREKSHQN